MKNRLYTDFVSDFNNFYREFGDRVVRWGIEPRLRLPYSWNGLNFLLNTTYYETAYLVDRVITDTASSWAERHTVKVEGDTNVQFVRSYDSGFLNLGQLESIIKPQIKYTFIPNSSTSGIPSTDPYDRILQQNTVTYSFNHYLYAMTPSSATPSSATPSSTAPSFAREISAFEVSQTYGLAGDLQPSLDYAGSGNRLSSISAKLTVFPRQGVSLVNQVVWDTSGNGVTQLVTAAQYSELQKYYVTLSHSYAPGSINEVIFDAGVRYKVFDLRGHITYSFLDQTWIDTLYQIVYRPGCWNVGLGLIQSRRPADTTFRLSIDLAGITQTGTGGIIP